MRKYLPVTLDQVLEEDRDEVAVDPLSTYEMTGVLSFGRGLFRRESVSGSETSYAKFTRLHTGQFVYSRLFAWEGAVAVVPESFQGRFVSPEFPTFTIRGDQALPEYLEFVCRWPAFHEALAGLTKGLGLRRQRVHPEQLLSVAIPLPDLDEQRHIASRLGGILRMANLLREFDHGVDELKALYVSSAGAILERTASNRVPLGDLIHFVQDVVEPGMPAAPAEVFIGLQHIDKHLGRRVGSLPVGDEKGPRLRFRPGDILFPRLRPYLNKAWVADRHGLTSVDQFIMRPHDSATADLLGHVLRSSSVIGRVIELTSNLQLPRIRLKDLQSLLVPNVASERRVRVLKELNSLHDKIVRLVDLRRDQEKRLNALTPSLLNNAFAGGL